MLHQTRGIVFKTVKYSETSVICKIYTEKFGVQSYMINGARSAKSKTRTLLQPLSLLSLVVYHRENKNLQRIKEMSFEYLFQSLPFEIVKSSIALFLIEILNKTIKEEEANPDLFEFVFNGIKLLDQQEEQVQNFHLYFLSRLSRLLGFAPGMNYSPDNSYFDLREGCFINYKPPHPDTLEGELSHFLYQFTYGKEAEIAALPLNNIKRRKLVVALLNYYELHVTNFNRTKSFYILENVLA